MGRLSGDLVVGGLETAALRAGFGTHEALPPGPEGVDCVSDDADHEQRHHHDQHDVAGRQPVVDFEAAAVEQGVVVQAGEAVHRAGAGRAAADDRVAGHALTAVDGVGVGGAGLAVAGRSAVAADGGAGAADPIGVIVGIGAGGAVVRTGAGRAGSIAVHASSV
jgi:hypothetical protein